MDSFSPPSFLKVSTPSAEGPYRASKWLKHQVLLSEEEMKDLLDALGSFFIYMVSQVVTKEQALIGKQLFLQKYTEYVHSLKGNMVPQDLFRPYFSSVFTKDPDALYAMEVGSGKYLIKAKGPIIQLQAHHFFVSAIDGKFHPMVLSKESISWGIQFSYPQIYQHPKDNSYSKVSAEFPNTALFTTLAKWLRTHTVATPFSYQGKRCNVPIRLGKSCFSWINQHPQLLEKNLSVLSIERPLCPSK